MNTAAVLEIVSAGPLASLQDAGRAGLRRLGIPRAGTVVEPWRLIANALVNNPPEAPVIEAFEAGLELRACGAPVRLAVVGDAALRLHRADGGDSRPGPCSSVTLADGDRLSVLSSGHARLVLVAVAGVAVEPHLGSVSTYARASLGGLAGRALQGGDRLPVLAHRAGTERRLTPQAVTRCLHIGGAIESDLRVLRAVAGPQDDAFDASTVERFFSDTGWQVSAQSDRMGCRLEGEPLRHRSPEHADIVSDAILPGAVQVPGNGLPIVMLADAHTAGGYPKIATVLQCDLPRLALARPGTSIRFERVDAADGVATARAADATLRAVLQQIEAVATVPDTARLLASNLVDGVVDAQAAHLGEDDADTSI